MTDAAGAKAQPFRKGQGRERLIAAATSLFGDRGFDAISTKELALAAGLTIGALYHHFASKEAIYRVALLETLESLPRAPLESASMVEPVAGVERLIAWFSETLLSAPLLRHELLSPHLDEPLANLSFFAEPLALFRKIMPAGAPGIDPQVAIGAIVSLSFGMASLKGLAGIYQPPHDSATMAHQIVEIITRRNVSPARKTTENLEFGRAGCSIEATGPRN